MTYRWLSRFIPTSSKSRSARRRIPQLRQSPRLDSLDRRDLPSVSYVFTDTSLLPVIVGNTGIGVDTISVTNSGTNTVVVNGVDTLVPSSSILIVDLLGDDTGPGENDSFDLSGMTAIDFPFLANVTVDGLAGANSLSLNDDPHFVFVLGNDGGSGSTIVGSPWSIQFAGIGSVAGGSSDDYFVFDDGFGLSGSLTGNGGTDSLDYSAYTSAVSVDLGAGSATGITGGATGFANAYGGIGNDSLTGTAGNNVLIGGLGDDTLATGAGGIDILDGGSNNDRFIVFPAAGSDVTITGGSDIDTVDFSSSVAGITIDMDSVALQVVAPGSTLTFTGASDVENFVGSTADDAITVRPLLGLPRVIDGNSPALPSLPGDTLFLDLLLAPAPVNGTLTVTGPGDAMYTSDNYNSLDYLSIETFVPNAPIPNIIINGTATVTDFRVVRNGAIEEIRDITGGATPGTMYFNIPYATLVNLSIHGTTAQTNRVVLDFGGTGAPIPGSAANPIPSGVFDFNGRFLNNGPTVLGDQFDVAGGGPILAAFNSMTASLNTATDGTVSFVDTGAVNLGTAMFENIEGLDLSGGNLPYFSNSTSVKDLTFNLAAGAKNSTVENFGPNGDDVNFIHSTSTLQIVSTNFPSPTNLLAIDTTAAAAQTVRLGNMDKSFAPVLLNLFGKANDEYRLVGANFLRTPNTGVSLAKSQFNMNGFSETVTWFQGDGDLFLDAGAILTTGDATNRTFSGTVTGSGGFIKQGSGFWTLSGSANNTFTGLARVDGGTLELKKSSGFQAIGGNLQIGDDIGGDDVDVVLLTGASEQIINSSAVSMLTSGLMKLNGFNESIGSLGLQSGTTYASTFEGNGGTLTLGGSVTLAVSGTGAVGADFKTGTLNLGSANLVTGRRQFSVADGAATTDLLVGMTVIGSAGLRKDGSGLLEFSANGNTYSGTTTILGGTYRVSGSLAGGPAGAVSLDAPGVIFEGGPVGTRTVNGRGVIVASTGTFVRNFVQLVNSTATSGITVNPGATGTISKIGTSSANGLRGNHTGIDVNGGTVRIETTYFAYDGTVPNVSDGNSYPAGLLARNGAVIDAGQPIGGAYDFTGLGTSIGGNDFSNFDTGAAPVTGSASPPAYRQAIVNLNTNPLNNVAGPQGAPYDLVAQKNTFDGIMYVTPGSYAVVERQVYHDVDSGGRGFVNYVNPASASATFTDGPRFYSVTPTSAANNAWAQRSMIRRARVSYDNFVFLNLGSGGVTLNRIASAAVDAYTGKAPGVVTLNAAGNSFDYNTGWFIYDMSFSNYSVEVSGSLMDGKYSMNFTPGVKTMHPTLGPAALPPTPNPVVFHRLFGDVDGNGMTTATDYTAFLMAFNSVQGSSLYREYLDFDNDRDVDSGDRSQFLVRYNRYATPI